YEIMASYELRKKLFDHQIVFDRQTFKRVPMYTDDGYAYEARVNTSTAKYSIKYPFSPVSALRFSLLYRNDQNISLSQSDYSLPKRPTYQNMAGTRLEYIYDNTRNIMLNIMNGLRFKIWTEYWQISETKG